MLSAGLLVVELCGLAADSLEMSNKGTVVKDIFKDYMSNATIHGFNRIVGTKFYCGRSLLWMLVVLGSATSLCVLIYGELSNYYSRPSVIKELVTTIEEEDLPSITFCPLRAIDGPVKTDETEAPTWEEMMLQKIMFPVTYVRESILSTMHLDLFGWQKPSQEDIENSFANHPDSGKEIYSASWVNNVLQVKACPQSEDTSYTFDCCGDTVTDVMTEIGKCKMLNMTSILQGGKTLIQDNKFMIIFSLNVPEEYTMLHVDGIQAIVHHPKDPPLPTMRGVFIPRSVIATLNIEATTRKYLPSPYKTPSDSECWSDKSVLKNRVEERYPGYQYSQEACESQLFFNSEVSACGCRHPWHPGTERLCTVGELFNCTFKTASDFKIDSLRESFVCPLPCSLMEYTVGVSKTEMEKPRLNKPVAPDLHGINKKHICPKLDQTLGSDEYLIVVDVMLPVTSLVLKQVPLKELEDVLSSLGGLMGLFLGFSIISLVEIGEVILLSLKGACSTSKINDSRTNINKGRNADKPKLTVEDCD